ncbi:MAG: glycine--tRNA ligase subunit beta [Woeseiaceae bacterium]|nr:glycine--tRNA ligase subunit beta [Woeseiaceae bacterium]
MSADFLVEIGTEELPPKALRSLMEAFAESLGGAVADARLEHGDVRAIASPRRLSVIIESLADGQADRKVAQKGPPVSVAFDDDGNPKPAAEAFAKKCGVAVAELGRTKTDKGEWLTYELAEPGRTAAELLPELVERALSELPIPRRMRWGDGDIEFVRPVHWVVMLHGDQVMDAEIMGVRTGNVSRGHRFLSDGDVTIESPGQYLEALEEPGYVIADFERRRELVASGVAKAASDAGGRIVDGELLYDEVTALVEWPVPVVGTFEDKFLDLPREVVISTLTGHQRYFPVEDENGELLPRFVTVANLESKDPEQVRDGNERVIRPRLADAAFFWETDRRNSLANREDALREVVYQRGLGSLHDKATRTAGIAKALADMLDSEDANVARAAMLAKCDLLTGMVGEFPDLQGLMGRYYAELDGEPPAVAQAIGEHYQPRFAGDDLPASTDGQVLSIADKLDTLAGVFTIGKKPSGNRDPFGLRRAALGIIRILVECELDVNLKALIDAAALAQPKGRIDAAEVAAELYSFITDRLRRYFLDRDASLRTETFDAVLAQAPASLVDFDNRLHAVQAFTALDAAESLAAANKRIENILKKAEVDDPGAVVEKRLTDAAEKALHSALDGAAAKVEPLLADRHYEAALTELAALKAPVDEFFDEVMVMADDETLRNNRLALLGAVRELFLQIADISRLSID